MKSLFFILLNLYHISSILAKFRGAAGRMSDGVG